MTLEQLQESTKEEIQNPKFKYTPANVLLKLGARMGDIFEFGFKRRNPGIARDDREEGNRKVKIVIGKVVWLLAAFCELNGFSLQECRDVANEAVKNKRANK